jgi:hypothetical protein
VSKVVAVVVERIVDVDANFLHLLDKMVDVAYSENQDKMVEGRVDEFDDVHVEELQFVVVVDVHYEELVCLVLQFVEDGFVDTLALLMEQAR